MADWLYFDKDTDGDSDLISRRAEIFRSKLITSFKLLDKFTEYGHHRRKGVLFSPDDIDNDQRSKVVLLEQPDGLVSFKPPLDRPEVIGDRRTNRLAAKTSTFPPLYLWAHFVVESPHFQNGILILILLNSIVLGIQGELENMVEPWVDLVKLVFDTFDYLAMFIYVMEIILKWMDSFTDFWKSSWNVFDCVVTFMFLIPEVMNWSTGEFGKRNPKQSITVLANNLRSFRILRTLKVVSRFQKIRLIIMAVTKAFQAMVFIALLLFTFAYIFSIIGVMFLQEGYTKESVTSLNYPKSFSGIGYALITLFQLFTLDHWLDVYQDMTRAGNPVFSICYIVIWILLGSFIFNNIFVGIMVNNFQSIRTELFKEIQGAKQKLKRESKLQELAENLEKKRLKAEETEVTKPIDTPEVVQEPTKMPLIPETILEENEEEEEDEPVPHKTEPEPESHVGTKITEVNEESSTDQEKEITDWVKTIEENLEAMRTGEQSFIWPTDTLFRYFRIMEVLLENLKERQEIMICMNEALLQMQDN